MSKLENTTKPYIEALLDNPPAQITQSAASILARWATKTAMVFEFTAPLPEQFYMNSERALLRTDLAIPTDTQVWMGVCVEQQHLYATSHRLRGSTDEPFRGLATTLVFGPIAIQVFTVRRPDCVTEDTRLTFETRNGPWQETLVSLWPARAISWPPSMGLRGEAGVEMLADRFSPMKGAA